MVFLDFLSLRARQQTDPRLGQSWPWRSMALGSGCGLPNGSLVFKMGMGFLWNTMNLFGWNRSSLVWNDVNEYGLENVNSYGLVCELG